MFSTVNVDLSLMDVCFYLFFSACVYWSNYTVVDLWQDSKSSVEWLGPAACRVPHPDGTSRRRHRPDLTAAFRLHCPLPAHWLLLKTFLSPEQREPNSRHY